MDPPGSQSQSQPQRVRRPRGKLAQLKCEFCRKDKQKCEPQAREWPEKCRRCELKGFPCSPNARKQRTPRRQRRATRTEETSSTPADKQAKGTAANPHGALADPHNPSVDPDDPTSSWTLVDFSNAVCAVKLLKRAESKLRRWLAQHESIFDSYHYEDYLEKDYLDGHTFFLESISSISATILTALKNRLHDSEHLKAVPEILTLRSLVYDATVSLLFPTGQKQFCVDLSGDSAIDSAQVLGCTDLLSSLATPSVSDLGTSLLRHDQIFEVLLSSKHTPDEGMVSAFTQTSFALQADFKLIFLHLEAQLRPGAPSILLDYQPIVFDSFHWMQLIDTEQHWQQQDWLGTSVLHFILENLQRNFPGRGCLSPDAREKLMQKISSTVSPSHPIDVHGRTVLHVAAQYGLADAVKALLKRGIRDLEAQTKHGSTALHYAAALGDLEVCRALLDHGADPNSEDDVSYTALHYAVCNQHSNIVELLLAQPTIRVESRNIDDHTPLMLAVIHDDTRRTYMPLINHPVDIFAKDDSRRAALHHAVMQGRVSAVRDLATLMEEEINDLAFGDTALHLAIEFDNPDASLSMVKSLLQNPHIDAGITNDEGKKPLYLAAEVGDLEICRLLGMRVDSGLLVSTCPGTPHQAAQRGGHQEVAELLEVFEMRVCKRILNAATV